MLFCVSFASSDGEEGADKVIVKARVEVLSFGLQFRVKRVYVYLRPALSTRAHASSF